MGHDGQAHQPCPHPDPQAGGDSLVQGLDEPAGPGPPQEPLKAWNFYQLGEIQTREGVGACCQAEKAGLVGRRWTTPTAGEA